MSPNAINAAVPAQGTEATVAGGTTITAGNAITVNAQQWADVDFLVGAVAAGAGGVGAGIGVFSTAFNTNASATGYYLFADPMLLPAIEVGFLNGMEQPSILLVEGIRAQVPDRVKVAHSQKTRKSRIGFRKRTNRDSLVLGMLPV